jgi:hypothetical protein
MSRRIRCYSDLNQIQEFEERFAYLSIRSVVGVDTFGYERWLNQDFYRSRQWKDTRNVVIARDYGRDLGIEGYEIHDKVIVHHMNPIAVGDIVHADLDILDPEYLICTSHRTHNAIHYGDESLLAKPLVQRRAGDTRLW